MCRLALLTTLNAEFFYLLSEEQQDHGILLVHVLLGPRPQDVGTPLLLATVLTSKLTYQKAPLTQALESQARSCTQ
jgi:hypothetical protein